MPPCLLPSFVDCEKHNTHEHLCAKERKFIETKKPGPYAMARAQKRILSMSDIIKDEHISASENEFDRIFTSHKLPEGYTFIYALFDENDKVVYVGRTKCLLQRVGSHQSDKEFSGYGYFIVPDEISCVEELKMYGKYRPKYNKTPPQSKYYLTLQAYKVKNPMRGCIKQIRQFMVDNEPDEIAGLYHIQYLHRMREAVLNG